MKRKEIICDEIIFPGKRSKAFTMSYDDGTVHDRRLVALMDRWGIRGTFNLNSAFLDKPEIKLTASGSLDMSKVSAAEISTLYSGHEIAGHGLAHASPTHIGSSAFMYETIADKANLEQLTGRLVRGYAYPFGHYDSTSIDILRCAGYHYARTVATSEAFDIPDNFMEWGSTCHHDHPKLMEFAEFFCDPERDHPGKKLFYVWGHSYEFAGENTWDMIESFCRYMGEHGDDIWFATNIEIYDYVAAYRNLEYSADGSMIYNPGGIEIFIRRGDKIHSIAPLTTATLDR